MKKKKVIVLAIILIIAILVIGFGIIGSVNLKGNETKVIDTQIHMGSGQVEDTLKTMDELGIDTVIVDELELSSIRDKHFAPYELLDNGTYRPINPTVQKAAEKYPGRFEYVLRVERTDPELKQVIQSVKDSDAGKAIRITPGMTLKETNDFKNGEYEELLSLVEDSGLPLFLYLPDNPELIAKTAENHPKLTIIVDHCGLYSNSTRRVFGDAYPKRNFEEQKELFDGVLALSKYDNVLLKWSHASENFETPIYPGDKLKPLLRSAIDAFGADRIMWASDYSVNTRGESWSDILKGIKEDNDLTQEELNMILGGTAKKYLK